MTKPKQHGGPRKGAGRKKTAGRVAVTRSVSMRLASWDKLDEMRGEQSRGKYIATNLNLNEWIMQLEAELESSCSAEHLRQEREARQKAEAKVQELDSLLTYSLQHSEKFREWAEAEVEELQSEIKMLTKKLSSTEDELADACEWLNERYKATSEADERAEKAEAELAEIKENCEQARLLAMSASRESATIGKTQRLETQNEKLRGNWPRREPLQNMQRFSDGRMGCPVRPCAWRRRPNPRRTREAL